MRPHYAALLRCLNRGNAWPTMMWSGTSCVSNILIRNVTNVVGGYHSWNREGVGIDTVELPFNMLMDPQFYTPRFRDELVRGRMFIVSAFSSNGIGVRVDTTSRS